MTVGEQDRVEMSCDLSEFQYAPIEKDSNIDPSIPELTRKKSWGRNISFRRTNHRQDKEVEASSEPFPANEGNVNEGRNVRDNSETPDCYYTEAIDFHNSRQTLRTPGPPAGCQEMSRATSHLQLQSKVLAPCNNLHRIHRRIYFMSSLHV